MLAIRYYLIIIFACLIFYTIILYFAKKKKPFKRAFMNMLLGLSVFISVDALSLLTGVYIPVSVLSLTVSACTGPAGVASMLIINYIL